ncbi:epoxide hydrolase [Naviculisporaceae sp. PSN 640]
MADPGTAPPSAAVVDEAVKPYKIHIPNKYLEQVKRKLELTRLPHEGSEPKSDDWWEPKPLVEPLIDFWYDKYNWREQETILNDTLPQYRTAITLPILASPLRLHFIHVRSPHESAVPLLLIPPFPFTNLSFGHLIKPLTDPSDPSIKQPFHLVLPSLPGLGFSDALPNNLAPIPATAEVFDSLMARLSYPKYLVSGASPGHLSPAEIDFKLINHLATRYGASCVGAHLISPPLEAPTFGENAWEFLKWTIANFFHAEILGYTVEDFQALDRIHRRPGGASKTTTGGVSELIGGGFDEPNTLAYALCDSPTGMLAFILKVLRGLRPDEDSGFSQEQLVTLTNLAWLPGPEYAMRFWAHCKKHEEEAFSTGKDEKGKKVATKKPHIGITVFTGDDKKRTTTTTAKRSTGDADTVDAEAGKAEEKGGEKPPLGVNNSERYICPAWANVRYNVVHTQRASGKAGGLLAFERPDVVIDGIRGTAKGLLTLSDSAFKGTSSLSEKGTALPPPTTSEPEGGAVAGAARTAPLEAVLVVPATDKGKGKELDVSPSPSPSPTPVRPAASPRPTTTGPPNPAATAAPTTDGLLSPPQLPRDHSFGDGSSPDTLVEGKVGKKASISAGAGDHTPSPLLDDNNSTLVSPSPESSPAEVPGAGASPSAPAASEGGNKLKKERK